MIGSETGSAIVSSGACVIQDARWLGRRGDARLTARDLDPLELLAGVVVAPVHGEQCVEPALGVVELEQTFADVGQGLQRDDVLAVEIEHVEERGLRGVHVAHVHVTAAQHDAGRDVVGMDLEAGAEEFEGALNLPVLAMHLGERRKREALGVLGVPALELLDLAKCHPGPGLSWYGSGSGDAA